jgi:hypothetical protein
MILVDDRAGSKELIKYPPLDSLGELTRLDSGDVCFTGNGPRGSILIGIEVKSIFDLISSLDSHRLQGKQIPDMLDFGYDVRYLLHYGNYRSDPVSGNLQIRKRINGKVQWTDYMLGKRACPFGFVESFLCSPSFTELGILSKRVIDVEEAVAWIAVLYRTWAKEYNKHKSMRVLYDNTASGTADKTESAPTHPGTLLPTDRNSALMYRAGVASKLARGIGYEKAVAAAKHFPSVRAMVAAGPAEWAQVPGIGKVLAKSVVARVEEEG